MDRPIECSDLLGEVDDLLVRAEGETWRVGAAVVDGQLHEVHWDRDRLALGAPASAAGLVSLRDDVLDRQLVDAAGRRVVRVGDIALRPAEGGLEAVALEVGLRPVLRRIGLHGLAARRREDLIRLRDVTVTPSCVVAHATAEHIAAIETHHLARLVRRLPHRMKHDVLGQLPEGRRREVHEHIRHRPHRPRLRRFRTPHA